LEVETNDSTLKNNTHNSFLIYQHRRSFDAVTELAGFGMVIDFITSRHSAQ